MHDKDDNGGNHRLVRRVSPQYRIKSNTASFLCELSLELLFVYIGNHSYHLRDEGSQDGHLLPQVNIAVGGGTRSYDDGAAASH